MSVVAEREQIPALVSLTPIRAWSSANPSGWKYAYDVYTDEVEQTAVNFQASDLIPDNKRVALFTDTEEDGTAMGALWTSQAPRTGTRSPTTRSSPSGRPTSASSSRRRRTPIPTS